MNSKSKSRLPCSLSSMNHNGMILRFGIVEVLIAVSVVAVPAYSQERPASRLIPRKAFFAGFEQTGFQSDRNGEHLFFKSTESATQIRYLDVDQPDKVNILETEKRVSSWLPALDGVLFVYPENGSQKIGLVSLDGGVSTFEPAFQLNTVSMLTANPINENHFVLSIVGKRDADSGILCL